MHFCYIEETPGVSTLGNYLIKFNLLSRKNGENESQKTLITSISATNVFWYRMPVIMTMLVILINDCNLKRPKDVFFGTPYYREKRVFFNEYPILNSSKFI